MSSGASVAVVRAHARTPIEDDWRRRLLAVRGYDAASMMTTSDVVDGSGVEDALAAAFADQATDFVHVHYARPGCFACRADRC